MPRYFDEGVFLQFGFWSNPPLVASAVELWTQNNPVFFVQTPPPNQSIRFPVATLPGDPGQVTAQFVCIGTQAFTCTGASSMLLASPALTFTW